MACPALVHPWIGCWLAAAAFLTLASGAEAQPRTSVVEGTVVDVSGAAIADAVISIRNADTSQVRVTATGREGSFRMPATPVGTYEVRVESSGFAPYMHSGITLSIGQTAHLAIVLVPAGVVETVAVSAQPPGCRCRTPGRAAVSPRNRASRRPPLRKATCLAPRVSVNVESDAALPSGVTAFNGNVVPTSAPE